MRLLSPGAEPSLQTAYHLLLAVLERGKEINGLHVAKLDIMAEKKHKYQLADIFFLVVAINAFLVTWKNINRLEKQCFDQS